MLEEMKDKEIVLNPVTSGYIGDKVKDEVKDSKTILDNKTILDIIKAGYVGENSTYLNPHVSEDLYFSWQQIFMMSGNKKKKDLEVNALINVKYAECFTESRIYKRSSMSDRKLIFRYKIELFAIGEKIIYTLLNDEAKWKLYQLAEFFNTNGDNILRLAVFETLDKKRDYIFEEDKRMYDRIYDQYNEVLKQIHMYKSMIKIMWQQIEMDYDKK